MNKLNILNTDVRVMDGLFSLNDLHKSSGGEKKHTPSRFMRLDQTKELIDEINRNPDLGFAQKTIKGGSDLSIQGVWVCKELVYYYAMWISPKFHLQVIRTFDEVANKQNSYIEMMNQLSAVFEEEKKKASKAGSALNGWKSKKRVIKQKLESLRIESQILLF
ncbi:MAG: KilA-N domain-containing protein [Vibrio sp.]